MAKIIMVDGTELILDILSIESLQKAIGGPIDVIRLPDRGRILINDEGAVLGLQVNRIASQLYGQRILGNVVLLEKDDKI